ncbi:hypothetical protein N7478_009849 [Penicillium angulare]|uniref:uncharacterized protein n=1 Tax=Penicillium angulare TaxID=116970 RepID=UPI0025409CD3|nr:uncharacterized protein N7478_009849 [Penicillium angulare]KAJ5267041.1 hypothetical protein N7478_009849 [Penicillium angulare]
MPTSGEDTTGLRNPIHNPYPSSFASECEKAAGIIDSFINPKVVGDGGIPRKMLVRAKALIICTMTRWGFLGCARFGSGVIVIRLPDGSWSAPSAVGLGGVGIGALLGIELTDFVYVLSTEEAVTKFIQSGCIHLGVNLSLALGLGRSAESGGIAGPRGISGFYSFSKTRGLFAGVSAEFGLVVERSRANRKVYERKLKTPQLANGDVPPPREAEKLLRILNSDTLRPQSKVVAKAIANPDHSGLQSLGREMPAHELADLSSLGPGLGDNEAAEAHWNGLSSPGLTRPRHLNQVPRELQGDTIQDPESAQPAQPAEPSPVFELDPKSAPTLSHAEPSPHTSVASSTINSSNHASLMSSVGNPLEKQDSLLTTPGIPESPSKEENEEHESQDQSEETPLATQTGPTAQTV